MTLQAFHKFESTTDALAAATALNESKMDKSLKKFLSKSILKKNLAEEKLGVIDSKLGGIIKEKLGIDCVSGTVVTELTRGLRNQLSNLLSDINEGKKHFFYDLKLSIFVHSAVASHKPNKERILNFEL